MGSNKRYAVAIDGPSGAGKSTLSRAAAAELGITYVDTGAIYRTIGCAVMARGIGEKDIESIERLLPQLDIRIARGEDRLQHMLLNGEDVSDRIRLPEISLLASAVSAFPAVRSYLLEMQRAQAREHSVIMDGRDIGTVVLPDAEVKIFLTAAPEVRARRRFLELEQRGTPQPFDELLREIELRDYHDTHREVAPLRRAEDAVEIDTSSLSFEESKRRILQTIRERAGL